MSTRPICDVDTPDPWMIAGNGGFYLTFTLSNRIEIWHSTVMDDFRNAAKCLVWKPQPGSQWSDAIWAPELHYLNNTWYIYSAAAHPGQGNVSHRTIILRSSSQDPMDSAAWHFLGPLQGLPDHWHIDATVFSPRPNELYCCYSGWPLGDFSDTEQLLFLIKMASPEQAIPNTLVVISKPGLAWERPEAGRRGINEGMAWVDTPFFRGIVFSANGSWTCDYRLGVLELVGEDLLHAASWKKRATPLLISSTDHRGPYGPGHASFIPALNDSGTIYCIYHATGKPDDGWANRQGRVMAMHAEHFLRDAKPICCPKAISQAPSQPQADGMQYEPQKTQSSNSKKRATGLVSRLKNLVLSKLC